MEISLSMADQILGNLLPMFISHVYKKTLFKDPKFVKYMLYSFAVSATLQLLIALYIKNCIAKKANNAKFKFKPQMSVLNLAEETTDEIEITCSEYDANEATKLLRGLFFSCAVGLFMFYKMNNEKALFIQTFGLLKNMFFSPLYRAYLFGLEIKRPFEKNLLFSTGTTEEQSEPAPTKVEKKKKKEE